LSGTSGRFGSECRGLIYLSGRSTALSGSS